MQILVKEKRTMFSQIQRTIQLYALLYTASTRFTIHKILVKKTVFSAVAISHSLTTVMVDTWMGANANVTRAFEAKLTSTATLNARPLVRRGKTSDTISHEIGPNETYMPHSTNTRRRKKPVI